MWPLCREPTTVTQQPPWTCPPISLTGRGAWAVPPMCMSCPALMCSGDSPLVLVGGGRCGACTAVNTGFLHVKFVASGFVMFGINCVSYILLLAVTTRQRSSSCFTRKSSAVTAPRTVEHRCLAHLQSFILLCLSETMKVLKLHAHLQGH